jgi:hypothetical protein
MSDFWDKVSDGTEERASGEGAEHDAFAAANGAAGMRATIDGSSREADMSGSE